MALPESTAVTIPAARLPSRRRAPELSTAAPLSGALGLLAAAASVQLQAV
jgi:hypothetical protein